MEGGGDISLSIRIDSKMPRPNLDKSVEKILTYALFTRRSPARMEVIAKHIGSWYPERRAVIPAWVAAASGPKRRHRDDIAKQTGVPVSRVKMILAEYNAFLKEWNSPAGLSARKTFTHTPDRENRFIKYGRNACHVK